MQKKSLIELVGTVSLVVVLLLVVVNNGRRRKEVKPQAPLKTGKITAPLAAGEANPQKLTGAELFHKLEEESKSLELKRDPFSASLITPVKKSSLELTGILWDKLKPAAIINNRVVKAGDRVGINTVVEIKQDRVILNDGNRNFELRL